MEYIKFLGSYGAKDYNRGTTSIHVSERTVIDAGNIITAMGKRAIDIEHVFLTHSHFDHLCDLPFMIDIFFSDKKKTLKIYGLAQTLETLKNSIFNYRIWPDFSEIKLLHTAQMAIEFIEIEHDIAYDVDGITLTPFKTNHTVDSCGYVIEKGGNAIMITADTYRCDRVWELLNTNPHIHTVVTETSFPSAYSELAFQSKHLTPALLAQELALLTRSDLTVYASHLKPPFIEQLKEEIRTLEAPLPVAVIDDGDIIYYDPQTPPFAYQGYEPNEISRKLIDIGISLSAQSDLDRLTDQIVTEAKLLTHSDGGTLYIVNEETKTLSFKVLQNDTLGIRFSAHTPENWPPIPLYLPDGIPNKSTVASLCALNGEFINISDAYKTELFDFTGTREFDRKNGYRSKSMLLAPLKSHEGRVIGVLQLINKKDRLGRILPFEKEDEAITRAFASQAAISINNRLLLKDLENLLEAFLKTINIAIDAKSPYTAGHIERMVDLTMMIADAIDLDQTRFANMHYSGDELAVLKIAALLHEIGKIALPEHILDKRTRLEALFDRIVLVRTKAEVLKRDLKITLLEAKQLLLQNPPDDLSEQLALLETSYEKQTQQLDDDIEFLVEANQGEGYFSDNDIERVKTIAGRTFDFCGLSVKLLNEDEIKNLTVHVGTLTDEQRDEINKHAAICRRMLEQLPFPKKFSRVPEIAASHHGQIDSSGEITGMHDDTLNFESRILAIANIFELLTAADRPYKRAKTPEQARAVLETMAKNGEVDPEIVTFFIDSGLYLAYAKKHIPSMQGSGEA